MLSLVVKVKNLKKYLCKIQCYTGFTKFSCKNSSLGNDLPDKIESMRSSGEPDNCTRPGTQYPGTWFDFVPCPGDQANPGNVPSLARTDFEASLLT